MKITAFEHGDQILVGSVGANGDVHALDDITSFWRDPYGDRVAAVETVGTIETIKERPALPASAKVICVGLNYRAHAKEANLLIPSQPVIFSRWASTLAASGEPAPKIEDQFDWEAELGVVIGQPLFRATRAQAIDGIFGYVAFNDLSARSFQLQTSQWTMGKNSPASGPMSAIATSDEVGDPAKGLRLITRVNGEIVQDGSTSDMIFSVPDIIVHISQAIALTPGDLIITGTPSGVGHATGRYLSVGDVVEVEIEGVGRVRTPIVEAPAAAPAAMV